MLNKDFDDPLQLVYNEQLKYESEKNWVNYVRNQSSDILQHSQNRPTWRQMVKILKYDNPYHKIKLKIRQIQVLGKSTG